MSRVIILCDCGARLWPSKEDKNRLTVTAAEQEASCLKCVVNRRKISALIDYTVAIVKAEGVAPPAIDG